MTKHPGKPFICCPHWVLLLLAVWIISNLIQTVQYVTADYSGVPMQDYWRVPELWRQYKAFHFASLPEITYIADMSLLRGRMYLPIALSGICYIGVWLVLAWAAYASKVLQSPFREAALLLAGVVIAWKGCSSVIADPLQLQFTMLQFTSALALLALWKVAATGSRRYLVASIGFAAVGTYCSGSGMLLWIVLIGAALWLKIGRVKNILLATSAVVFVGAYFAGQAARPSNIPRGWEFLCSFMSMPFGSFGAGGRGILTGAVNILLMSACFTFAWRRGLLRSGAGIVVFGLYLFTLLSAMTAATGRLSVTLPTVAWGLLVFALVWLVSEAASQRWFFVTAGAIACFLFWGFRSAADWMESTRAQFANAQIVSTMLGNEVFEPALATTVFPTAEFVRTSVNALKEDRKSIYARGGDKWIGQDLEHLNPQRTPIQGKITRVYPVPGGLEILGWADTTWLTGDHAIIFVDDATNKIAGYGRRPRAGFPAAISGWDMPDGLQFVGFVRIREPGGQRLSVYVRTFHGKLLQPLDSKIEVPNFTALEGNSDAPLVPGITWRTDGNWSSGYRADAANGPLPSGPVFSSRAGGGVNENRGAIRTEPFAAPSNHCLVLPVLHGASTYGQAVEVRDGDADQPIAQLPMLDGHSVWQRWRIPLPDATRRVTIVADDEGSEPSQWTAVTTPQQCP